MSFSSDNPTLSNQVPISLDISPKEENFQDHLILYLRRMANSVNTKDQGFYLLQETGNFQQWFNDSTPIVISQNRNGYRITVDFVALNGGNIPNGTTTLTLTSSTTPRAIVLDASNTFIPTRGVGGATDTTGTCYFPSDPNVVVTFMPSTQTFTVINNTGNALTQFYWVMEFLKS